MLESFFQEKHKDFSKKERNFAIKCSFLFVASIQREVFIFLKNNLQRRQFNAQPQLFNSLEMWKSTNVVKFTLWLPAFDSTHSTNIVENKIMQLVDVCMLSARNANDEFEIGACRTWCHHNKKHMSYAHAYVCHRCEKNLCVLTIKQFIEKWWILEMFIRIFAHLADDSRMRWLGYLVADVRSTPFGRYMCR